MTGIINCVILFILGLAAGSFLNVLIDRLPEGKDVIFGRSRCDYCRKNLAWFDLIPVLSFFMLAGRCRYCNRKLSFQYPVIELSTGILFPVTFLLLQNHEYLTVAKLISTLFIFSGLWAITLTDIKYMIIPDEIILVLSILIIIYLFIVNTSLLITNIITGLIALLIFAVLVIITRGKGMGLGDVKLAFLMGLLLGFPKIVVSLYLAFLTGALISLILIVIGKKGMKSTIPFGPFLCIAAAVSYLYGEDIWLIITKLIGI